MGRKRKNSSTSYTRKNKKNNQVNIDLIINFPDSVFDEFTFFMFITPCETSSILNTAWRKVKLKKKKKESFITSPSTRVWASQPVTRRTDNILKSQSLNSKSYT